MADWTIERLSKDHEREAFSCGNASLDLFLRDLAGQYEKRGIGRTFVATKVGEVTVRGYYTSTAGSLDLSALPDKARKKLPKHPLPTIHLGRLAVDQSCQGQRLGETLLFHFLRAAWEAAKTVGAYAVDVRATDEKAYSFYLRYGFIPLLDSPLHLFLPLKTVEQLFDQERGEAGK